MPLLRARGLRAAALAASAVTAVTLLTTAVPAEAGPSIRLKFLGVQTLPHALQFQDTTVGGLSGISYDARSRQYYIISDDRSAIDPARFYTAKIAASTKGLSVTLTGTHPWLRPDGTTYPPTSTATTPPTVAPDPEAIAVNPKTHQLYWTSEGERILPTASGGATVLGDPFLQVAREDGSYVKALPIPKQFHMSTQPVGPRKNQTLEGLSFTPDGKQLWLGLEDPLYQDGADPTPTSGALTRITRYDAKSGRPVSQYAYPLEKLFATPPTADSTDTNGTSDVLALGNGKLLVTERAAIAETGVAKVRLYLADVAGATDVLHRDSLLTGKVKPLRKRLLLDLDDVPGIKVDNFEGVTLGPRLPDGRRLLVMVVDDNFSTTEVTEFLAFAVSGL